MHKLYRVPHYMNTLENMVLLNQGLKQRRIPKKISDKEAYSNEHFINYTQQPLLKVLSWRYYIYWLVWREHAKQHLKIKLKKPELVFSLLVMIVNKLFKTNFNNPANNAFNKIIEKFNETRQEANDDFYNTGITTRLGDTLRLLLPWNKLTYPFIVTLIAFKETRGNERSFFKLIFGHLLWSMNFLKKMKLPTITLRKTVAIDENDPSVLLRKGR